MKLKKILFSSIAIILILVSSISFLYATETTDAVIKSFAEAIDTENWSEVTELYSDFEKNDIEVFFNNQNNEVEKIGFYSIEEFELIDYLKINNDDLSKFATIGKYADIYDTEQFVGYRITANVKCDLESKYFYNGLNYFLIILVNEDNNWKIAEFSSASPELINYAGNTSKVTTKTIKNYDQKEDTATQIVADRNKGVVLNGNGEVIETNQATSEDILIEKGYSHDEISKVVTNLNIVEGNVFFENEVPIITYEMQEAETIANVGLINKVGTQEFNQDEINRRNIDIATGKNDSDYIFSVIKPSIEVPKYPMTINFEKINEFTYSPFYFNSNKINFTSNNEYIVYLFDSEDKCIASVLSEQGEVEINTTNLDNYYVLIFNESELESISVKLNVE